MGRKPGTATICLVCGDKACGVNFNAPSCMSCKTFFRRNALRQMETICQFGDNCKVDQLSRRFCTKCRLKKCFSVGMKKEMIKSNDEKEEMRAKIRSNHTKRISEKQKEILSDNQNKPTNSTFSLILLEPVSSFTLASTLTPSSVSALTSASEHSQGSVENMKPQAEQSNEMSFDSVQPNNIDPIVENLLDFDPGDESLYELNSTLDEYCDQILLNGDMSSNIDLSDIEVIPLEKEPDQNNSLALFSQNTLPNLNQNANFEPELTIERIGFPIQELILPEQKLILELVSAGSILKNPYKRIENFRLESPYSHQTTQYTFSRLIKMSKQLNGFNQLSQSDQRDLLKNRLIPMLCIRTVLMHNRYRKAIAFVNDRSKSSVMFPMDLIKPYCVTATYERQENYSLLFRDEWKQDEAIFDLLTAIVLFTPNFNYQDYDRINTEHHQYIRLLHRYLHQKYADKSEADDCFNQLMYNLKEGEILTVDIVRFFRGFKAKYQYSPFFAKLLDLNQNYQIMQAAPNYATDHFEHDVKDLTFWL